MNAPINSKYAIAGKCCESSDIIAYDVELPRPTVVFVKDSASNLAIKRKMMEDLVKKQL